MDRPIAAEEPVEVDLEDGPDLRAVAEDFDGFYRATRPGLLRLAFLLTGSSGVAEEVVHDAFVRLLDRWDRVAEPRAYVRRSVVNGCRSWHRHRFVARRREHLLASESSHLDRYRDLNDALGQLSIRRRSVVVLRYFEGLSLAEIAQVLRVSEGTVKSTLHRGLAHLKELLDEQ